MQFSIRAAKAEDIPKLANLYVEVYKKTNPIEKWTFDSAKVFISYFFLATQSLFFIGESDGIIVGAVWGNIKPWWNGNKLYDIEIFIKEEYRNYGFSKLLFIKLFEDAINVYNIRDVEAITFNDREFPLDYYARIEFNKNEELVLVAGEAEIILKKLVK